MSLDIYARVADADNVIGPAMDFKHADMMVLRDEAKKNMDFEGDPFVLNPDYIPGVAISMSGGNFFALMKGLGYHFRDENAEVELEQLRTRCLEKLTMGNDAYVVQRLIELVNICELGLTRGATHLTWV